MDAPNLKSNIVFNNLPVDSWISSCRYGVETDRRHFPKAQKPGCRKGCAKPLYRGKSNDSIPGGLG